MIKRWFSVVLWKVDFKKCAEVLKDLVLDATKSMLKANRLYYPYVL